MSNHSASSIKGFSTHWDALRGICILLFMVIHTRIAMDNNIFPEKIKYIALPSIELIFILSGFLITRRAFAHWKESSSASSQMKTFAFRRFLRTWPLYYLFVGVSFLFPHFSDLPIEKPFWQFATFTMNFNLGKEGLAHLWSLCLEEWCYFLFLFVIPFLQSKRLPWIFLALAIAPIIGRLHLMLTYGEHLLYFTQIHFSTFYHWDSFWWGCLFGYWDYKKNGLVFSKKQQISFLFICFLIGVVYVESYSQINPLFRSARILFNPEIGAIASILLIYGIRIIPSYWLKISGLQFIGIMSYTAYLIHKKAMYGFSLLNRSMDWLPAKSLSEALAAYVFTLLASAIVYAILERPIIHYLRATSFSKARTKKAPPNSQSLHASHFTR